MYHPYIDDDPLPYIVFGVGGGGGGGGGVQS